MHYNDFFNKLKIGDLSGVFLFHGEEEYIKQSALRQLMESIDPVSRDLNMQQCRSPLHQDVLAACETLPFFSDRRLIICIDMADAEITSLLEKCDDLPPTTTLVVCVRGNIKAELKKLIKGRDVLFTEMTETEALRFIKKRVRAVQKEIGEHAARALIEMVGKDAYSLANELEKAIHYSAQQTEITEDILKKCVTVHQEYEYMQMLNQFLKGRKKEAFSAMKQMQKKEPRNTFMLASSFAKQFNYMLSARILLDEGTREKDISSKLALKPWAAGNALYGAKRMNAERLRAAVAAFSEIDHLQVSGKMNADLALEIAVTKYL